MPLALFQPSAFLHFWMAGLSSQGSSLSGYFSLSISANGRLPSPHWHAHCACRLQRIGMWQEVKATFECLFSLSFACLSGLPPPSQLVLLFRAFLLKNCQNHFFFLVRSSSNECPSSNMLTLCKSACVWHQNFFFFFLNKSCHLKAGGCMCICVCGEIVECQAIIMRNNWKEFVYE